MAREYDIAEVTGQCSACGRKLAAEEEFIACLFEAGEGFRRDDFCKPCWQKCTGKASEAFSVWHSQLPVPDEPKTRFVDNKVLVEFFEKLEGQDEPSKVNFRFVLALMLMRKKLLIYDGSARDDAPDGAGGQEVWTMHFRNEQTPVKVIRPQLDEEKIADVSAKLACLFEGQT